MILFHGTSAYNARRIENQGFISGKKYNWKIKSKPGFVYLSLSYAPFYAEHSSKTSQLALIKCQIAEEDCYPEDDFMMYAFGKKTYSQEDIDSVDLEKYKEMWLQSLTHIGNIAVKSDKAKILGIKYFNGKNLLFKCDPVISPINFKVMGEYYNKLSEWIYEGNEILKFASFTELEMSKWEKSKKQ